MGISNQGQAGTQACLPDPQQPVHGLASPPCLTASGGWWCSLGGTHLALTPGFRRDTRSRWGPISQLLSPLKIFTSKYVPVCHASASSQPGRLSSPPGRHYAMRLHQPQLHRAQSEQGAQLAGRHPPCKAGALPWGLCTCSWHCSKLFPHRACAVHMGSHGVIGSCHLSKRPFLPNITQIIFSAAVLCHVISSIEFFSHLPVVTPNPGTDAICS